MNFVNKNITKIWINLIDNVLSIIFYIETSFTQSLFNNIIDAPFFIIDLSGTTEDCLYRPRDLDFHTDSSRPNELWVINENSAIFDPTYGGSTVTFYNAGSDSLWMDYRKDSYSAHFMNTASAIAFSSNYIFISYCLLREKNLQPKIKVLFNNKKCPDDYLKDILNIRGNFQIVHIRRIVYLNNQPYAVLDTFLPEVFK